jgi:hypothetical protein
MSWGDSRGRVSSHTSVRYRQIYQHQGFQFGSDRIDTRATAGRLAEVGAPTVAVGRRATLVEQHGLHCWGQESGDEAIFERFCARLSTKRRLIGKMVSTACGC